MKKLNELTRSINKVGFKIKKRSPEILLVAGITGVVTSAVMACKATTKLNGVLDDAKEQIDKIHQVSENPESFNVKPEDYTPEDGQKDLTIVYVQTAVKVAKLYGPSVILGALSITSILASNNILRKRNVALAAAYTVVDKSFKDYRGRVVERFGEELDRELKYNIKAQEIEETIVDEKGKEKTVKKTVNVISDTDMPSQYARFFDEGNLGWEKDPEYNLMFLRRQQAFANEKLQTKGHLFLNEVYDMLDIPRTTAGQVVGWTYDPSNPAIDSYVDFGIYNYTRERARAFVNGYESVILLDFNVDGDISYTLA